MLAGDDLGGIGTADGGDLVGEQHARLKQAKIAEEFERPETGGHPVWEVQPMEVVGLEPARIVDVVDGQHGLDGRPGVGEISVGQRRMPVVHMQDIGPPSVVDLAAGELCGHPAEHREAQQVVAPILTLRRRVGCAGTPEHRGRVDDVYRRGPSGQAPLQHAHVCGAEESFRFVDRPRLLERVEDRRETRHHRPRIGALSRKSLRQRGGHIGKTTGFDPRRNLGSGV